MSRTLVRRFAALLAALALLGTACSFEDIPFIGDDPPANGDPAQEPGDPGGPGDPGDPGDPDSPPGRPPGEAPAYADAGRLGEMARAYLRSSPASRLVVEIGFVEGRQPASGSLRHLERILERETDKPGGVSVQLGAAMPAARDQYSVDDLRALEREHRREASAGDTATMWVAFVNGTFAGGAGALGVAYSASAAAVFRDRVDRATTALVLASAIERAVLVHEVGHLLALVNIGYQSAFEGREDPDSPHHSSNRGSVMYWAVNDIDVVNILAGGPPDDFDEWDRGDLAALRAGA